MKTVKDVYSLAVQQFDPNTETVIEKAMQMWADEQTEQLQVTNLELTRQLNARKQIHTEVATLLRGFAVQSDRAEQLAKLNELQIEDAQKMFNGFSEFMRQCAIALNPPKVKKNGQDNY